MKEFVMRVSGRRARAAMIHRASTAALALALTAPVFAQAPAGWKQRVDRSSNASDPDAAGFIKFVAAGSGFHATAPQAAVFWNAANTAAGAYTLKATFTLLKPSGHVNYYGLVFGAGDLAGHGQDYLYFMVAQDGTWLIKHRSGDIATQNVAGPTANAAVKRPDGSGKSVNALEVRVKADAIDYVVNGAVVHSTPRTGRTAKTDGVYGLRVNHMLDVQIDGLSVVK
jgi:hypothetical protein